MNERIKSLRKSLGLTLEEFGARIGIGKSAASKIENGRNGATDQTIKSICREFHVREAWLRTGEGEMYEPDIPANDIDRILTESGATGLEAEVIKAYLELSPELRKAFIDHFRAYFARKKASAGQAPPGLGQTDGEEAVPHDDA